jgi:hypothetical protein
LRVSDRPTPDDVAWSRARHEFLADEREREAERRERSSDERDRQAHERARLIDRGNAGHDRAGRARAAARAAREQAAIAREQARSARVHAQGAGSPTILAKAFADLALELFAPGDIDDVFRRITAAAVDLVPGCDAASITLRANRRFETPVATDDAAVAADELQYAAGQGPCIDALEQSLVHTPDADTDQRWPRLSNVSAVGLHTVASFGLFDAWSNDSTGRAGLNVYGKDVDAIDEHGRELGLVLAAYAATAFVAAEERHVLRQREIDLHEALQSRDVIGQAKGILMERQHLTPDQAFDVLRRASQSYNIKLRDVAARLAETGEVPGPI